MDEIDVNGPAYLGGFMDAIKDREQMLAREIAAAEEKAAGVVRTSNGVWKPSEDSGIPITVTQPDDPAMALLMNPNIFSTPVTHRRGCYICEDPEFAQMGLPLCRVCTICGGHIAADDCVCDDCGADDQEIYYWEREPAGVTSPYYDLSVDELWP